MSTKIEWCDETINPIVGCTKISPACDNCYAEVMARRLAGMPHTKEKYSQVITNGKWNGKVVFDQKELEKPFRWKKPRRIFITSMGDLFHENVSHAWLMKILEMIYNNPHHTFIVLTKRPDRMKMFFDKINKNLQIEFPNLWLGVTAENQEQAEKRIPILLQIPAAIHFVSCEPLLGEIDLPSIFGLHVLKMFCGENEGSYGIQWVIAGGETGHNSRVAFTKWFLSLRDQCKQAGIPFFFKGYGAFVPITQDKTDRLLEGKQYNEFPKI